MPSVRLMHRYEHDFTGSQALLVSEMGWPVLSMRGVVVSKLND